MARFFGKPTFSDHLDGLLSSWFVKSGSQGNNDSGDNAPPPPIGLPDDTPILPDHELPDAPDVGDIVKFWLHKIFGGHHNPPPPPVNHAPQILSAQQTGRVAEGDSTDLLTVGGTIRFIDRDLGDTQTAQVEFVSTTNPSGEELGGLEAVVNPDVAGGVIAADALMSGFRSGLRAMDWSFAVNDADIQNLSEGQVVLQTYRVTVTDAVGA
jgi:hypothetical protein